jgi:hypothetical protein
MAITTSRAEQFRQRSRITLTLPSGLEIIARKADFTRLMQLGYLPDSLGTIVSQAIAQATSRRGGKSPINADAMGKQISDAILADPKGMFMLQDAMLKACGIDPVFVDEVTDPETQVAVSDVDPEDKQFIMQWAQGGTADVAAFRAEQQRNVPAGPEGEAVREAAG